MLLLPPKEIEFIKLLRSNQVKTPNEFTVQMGQLIQEGQRRKRIRARPNWRKRIFNRRPATLSDIENGKSEIGVLTLVLFTLELQKPISYFFPDSLLKEWVTDVKAPLNIKCSTMPEV